MPVNLKVLQNSHVVTKTGGVSLKTIEQKLIFVVTISFSMWKVSYTCQGPEFIKVFSKFRCSGLCRERWRHPQEPVRPGELCLATGTGVPSADSQWEARLEGDESPAPGDWLDQPVRPRAHSGNLSPAHPPAGLSSFSSAGTGVRALSPLGSTEPARHCNPVQSLQGHREDSKTQLELEKKTNPPLTVSS